jgi:chemotaxis protein CheD
MNDDDRSPAAGNYLLKPGYIYIAEPKTIMSTVLGSSVSVCLFDRKRKVAGMNHFRLPFTRDAQNATADYGNVATLTLIRMLVHDGSDARHLEAQVFGGAYNTEISPKDIGRENVSVAKKVLLREKIRIVSEDIGGEKGRKIVFDPAKNETAVIKVDKLRKGDWFPYEDDRA